MTRLVESPGRDSKGGGFRGTALGRRPQNRAKKAKRKETFPCCPARSGVLAYWWLSLRLGLVLLSLWLSGFGFFPFPLLLFRATSQGTFASGLWPRASRSSSRREGRRARRMGTDPRTGLFKYPSLRSTF